MALRCNSLGDKKNEKGGLWVLPQLGYRGLGPCWGVQGGEAEIEFQRLKILKNGISWLQKLTFDNTAETYDLVEI